MVPSVVSYGALQDIPLSEEQRPKTTRAAHPNLPPTRRIGFGFVLLRR
jgi:hypothetical protein